MSIRQGWKIYTHDWCSPIQGGEPIHVKSFPYTLPPVTLDTSDRECGAGYNYCQKISTAAKIAGFWSGGRPSNIVLVEAGEDAIERGNKCRTSSLTLLRQASKDEIKQAMRELVSSTGPHTEQLTESQFQWFEALGRPHFDENRVRSSLEEALVKRGLSNWKLQIFKSAWDAWDAWKARDVWDAWNARGVWDVWGAWDALILETSVRCFNLTGYQPDLLTVGIRDAYKYGLEFCIPVAEDTLGYVMASPK